MDYLRPMRNKYLIFNLDEDFDYWFAWEIKNLVKVKVFKYFDDLTEVEV